MPPIEVPTILLYSAAFFLIAIAAKQIGAFFSRYGLPYITGYLLAGALSGPFILSLMPADAATDLRYIDDVSLAVIAFVAGSELYLKELRGRLRSILLNAAGISVAALLLIGTALYFLQFAIPFTATLPPLSKVAVSILGATILLALSPASTIAVIQEVRAKGPFSKTVLSITVVMDVVIIILFAISVAIANTLLSGDSFDVNFLVILVIDIVIAILAGLAIGGGFRLLLDTSLGEWVKAAIIILTGLLVFEASYRVPDWVLAMTDVKIKIEPLLIAMIAGFTVTNFTPHRHQFEDILQRISPYIYVAFFALTGFALKLDILLATIGIAAALFAVRMGAIFVGTYIGGMIAGEPQQFRRWAWLGLITQAGIALGLARETAVEFPDTLGTDFSTLIIAVVVLNEIFGPLFLKFALRQVDETHEKGKPETDEVRDTLIFGVEQQSLALARKLKASGWQVKLVDTNPTHLEQPLNDEADNTHLIEAITVETLSPLLAGVDALVVMLDDDEANFHACEIAYEQFGIRNMIVRLQDMSKREQFSAIGVRVIDPASAMIGLLDHYVRTPEATELLLHITPGANDFDITQVTVTDQDVSGVLLRDLRLPADVLVLEIKRKGQTIVPHGYTKINLKDEVTFVGKPESLKQVTLQFGF